MLASNKAKATNLTKEDGCVVIAITAMTDAALSLPLSFFQSPTAQSGS